MTAVKLRPAEFLKLANRLPVVDVRSPREYIQGHIPGAHPIPLFTDEERARVGLAYTRSGNQDAVMKGLEIVGPKLGEFVLEAKKIAPQGEILVHCWRGGMRSEAMAWLFNFSGMKARLLEGGYKAYRSFIRQSFETGPELRVVGGMTGSGKTELLFHLSEKKEQVIDLEALAHHKGSAFGGLGLPDQPTTEQFENELAGQWIALNPLRPVWIEDESLNIGKVVIPDVFFKKMRSSALYFIDVPFDVRVDRLLNEYGHFDRVILKETIMKISKRMGGDVAKAASDSLADNEIRKAVEIVLRYYDQSYRYSLESRGEVNMIRISGDDFPDPGAVADYLKTAR